ncbi:MAG TPA: hypothetical protein VE242_06690 [Chthoniobacterales bacterium]|nr:hypothetical protein [Chthoniobacterales bacterium]
MLEKANGTVLPPLASGPDGSRDDSRPAIFVARLEAGMAPRLSAAPEPMLVPLGQLLRVKEGGER